MKRFAQKYVAFVRQRDVPTLLAIALVTRMPVGMVAFAMLMFLREALGSFALAGAAVGVGFVTMAACGPIQGRLIDRRGPLAVLRVTAVVQPLALLAILLSARAGLPVWVVAAFSALSGMFASPITTLTRTVWRHRFERDEDRRTAFALDSVAIELNFTLGPALIAFVLSAFGATAAFATAIVAVVLAAVIFLNSPGLRWFKPEAHAERHLLGPLTEPRLWLLFATIFGVTLSFGAFEVGYPAYATFLAMPALAGVLLALNSFGSAIGGAIYGGLHFKAPVERQFAAAIALMSVPLLLHVFALDHRIALGALAFLAGALIAPTIAAQSVLVSRLAPSHYATEAFTWSSTFIVSGLGAGMALSGVMVEHAGLATTFGVSGAIVAAMALLALALPVGRTAAPASAD